MIFHLKHAKSQLGKKYLQRTATSKKKYKLQYSLHFHKNLNSIERIQLSLASLKRSFTEALHHFLKFQ